MRRQNGFRADRRPEQEFRTNRDIRFREILVIAPNGDQLGVMSPDDARAKATAFGLDLVEVAPNSRPPVCRIMDYGKFKYDRAKKSSQANKSQPSVKEIRLRPKTDEHDLRTKLEQTQKFLQRGDKVRVVMRMRGRERAYPGRWVEQLRQHFGAITEIGKITSPPRAEGRSITMLIEPLSR